MTMPLLAAAPPRLRPYQVDAVEAIRGCLDADRATLLVLATGLGKTICFAEVVRRVAERGGRSLVLAHRTELLEQAGGKLAALGLDVGLEQAKSRAGAHTAVVASVQTLQRKRLARWAPDHFDLVVIDEAHHAAAKSYRNVLEHFESAKLLGVTATPDRGDGKALGALFNSVAYRYEIAEAITDGWLSPIRAQRIVVDGLDLSAVRTTAGDLNAGDLDLAMREPAAVRGIADPVVKLSKDRPTLVFTVTVDHARALATAINDLEPHAAVALDGTSTREHRADVIHRYRNGDVRVLVNCALFTEGFDAPLTSCIAVARPTKSRALYAQMLGRGTRKDAGKSDCLVLDFAGLAGRHRLVGPADVLAGAELDDDVLELAQELMADGADVLDAIAEARALADERARERRKRQPPIGWSSVDVDLFGNLFSESTRDDWVGVQVTRSQREILDRKGINAIVDKAQAADLIETLRARQNNGLCTYKQARVLAKHGVNGAALSFDDARELLDGLARHRWRPTTTWMERARKLTATTAETARER